MSARTHTHKKNSISYCNDVLSLNIRNWSDDPTATTSAVKNNTIITTTSGKGEAILRLGNARLMSETAAE